MQISETNAEKCGKISISFESRTAADEQMASGANENVFFFFRQPRVAGVREKGKLSRHLPEQQLAFQLCLRRIEVPAGPKAMEQVQGGPQLNSGGKKNWNNFLGVWRGNLKSLEWKMIVPS